MSHRSEYWTAAFVWRWANAPAHLKALIPPSRRGLWLSVIPKQDAEEQVRWMAALGPLVSRHPLTDGDVCLIGAESVADD